MASYEKTRTKIFSTMQHILAHSLDELEYGNQNLPDVITNAREAMDWLFNVVYPKTKPSVETPADLPTGTDTPNVGDVTPEPRDMRFVNDDGDGNAALYQWEKYDGDAAYEWKKIADMDWGINGVVSALIDQTQPLFVHKFGITDYDLDTELPLAGDLAGQHIYGGDVENQNLTLHANNGDTGVAHTGAVQVDDLFRPLTDLEFDLGDATHRWSTAYMGTAVIGTGTMTITSDGITGSITDTSGSISFGDEALATTGDFDGGNITATGSLVSTDGVNSLSINPSTITSTLGSINLAGNELSTTGTVFAGAVDIDGILSIDGSSIVSSSGSLSFGGNDLDSIGRVTSTSTFTDYLDVDDIVIDGNLITTTSSDLNISSTADVNINRPLNAVNADFVGTVTVDGVFEVDELVFNGNFFYTTNVSDEIFFGDSLIPLSNGVLNIGRSDQRLNDIFMAGSLGDGLNTIGIDVLLSLRDITVGANNGDAIFWDGGKFVASNPDSEISHSELNAASLLADDHTQYALLAGRTGGQTLSGGDTPGDELFLKGDSTSPDGILINSGGLSFSSTSADLGGSGAFRNLVMNGQAYGLRAQNSSVASIASQANASTAGRLWYGDNGFLYVDRGGTAAKVGQNTYNQVLTNVQLQAAVTVTPSVSDPRNCLWQLCDMQNSEEVMAVPITKNATQVTIVNSVDLPPGNYRLIGIEL